MACLRSEKIESGITMILTERQLEKITSHEPIVQTDQGLLIASIAIILRDGPQGTEFLLMQRAKHDKDPWSGQMAFPGGKFEPNDITKKATAIRETAEEVGIHLNEQDYLGQLDDLYGVKENNKYNVIVSCYVFKTDRILTPKGNYEVADLVWLPMSYLQNSKNCYEYYHPKINNKRMPAVLINQQKEQVLWGLSLRMLTMMYQVIDTPMSVPHNIS